MSSRVGLRDEREWLSGLAPKGYSRGVNHYLSHFDSGNLSTLFKTYFRNKLYGCQGWRYIDKYLNVFYPVGKRAIAEFEKYYIERIIIIISFI